MAATDSDSDPAGAGGLAERRVIGDRYEVGPILGEGATGVVYRGRCLADDSVVALKVIHRHLSGDRQIPRRFEREALILKRLSGPHLAALLDFFEDEELLVLALEYVEGVSLEKRLADGPPMTEQEAVSIALEVCAALTSAHGAGVIHRDLKPGNVLLEPRGEGAPPRVRVVDFGLAKVVAGESATSALTEQDMIFGTPEYMAPEQVRGDDADARCDIYALGVMLYEMVVGAPPFSATTPIGIMTAQLTSIPPPPRSARPERRISAAIEAVILRALEKNPAARYPSADDFAAALRAASERTAFSSSAEALASSDTDLAIAIDKTDLAHRPTLPAGLETRSDESLSSAKFAGENPHGLWLFVAALAVVMAVAIGAIFGFR